MRSADRRPRVDAPLPRSDAAGLSSQRHTGAPRWTGLLAIAGLVLALASGPVLAKDSGGKSGSSSNGSSSAKPAPSSAPRQSFGSFGSSSSSSAKRESAAAPSRSAPAASPARSDDRPTRFGSFGSAPAKKDAAPADQASGRPERKPQPATSFGSFGGGSQKTEATKPSPAAPPLQAARPNSSVANDLSNSTARNQAMRSFDNRQQPAAQPSPQAARAEAQAAAAIAHARQSGAAPTAQLQRQPPAPAGPNVGGYAPAGVGVGGATAAYERDRRIQAERLADQRQRALDEANERAYRAQRQQQAQWPVDDRPARPSAPRNGMGLGTGVGVAAGAVAGAALATAATAGTSPPSATGTDSGGSAIGGLATVGDGSTPFKDAAARVPPAPAPADSGLGGAWIFITLGALVIGLYIRARRLKAQAAEQTQRYVL